MYNDCVSEGVWSRKKVGEKCSERPGHRQQFPRAVLYSDAQWGYPGSAGCCLFILGLGLIGRGNSRYLCSCNSSRSLGESWGQGLGAPMTQAAEELLRLECPWLFRTHTKNSCCGPGKKTPFLPTAHVLKCHKPESKTRFGPWDSFDQGDKKKGLP